MIKEYSGSLYGTYRTKKFSDTWTNVDDFIKDYQNIGIPTTIPVTSSDNTEASATTLYYLLYARYGNETWASDDPERRKYGLFSIIWQYAPAWQKDLEIQRKLRSLSDDELQSGSFQVSNVADNPSTDPATDSSELLKFVKAQQTNRFKKGKLEAYSILDSMLKKDVTESFLGKFKKLFKTIVEPEDLLLYENIEEEN